MTKRKSERDETEFDPDALGVDVTQEQTGKVPEEAPAKPTHAFDPKTGEHRPVLDHETVVHGRIQHPDFDDPQAQRLSTD